MTGLHALLAATLFCAAPAAAQIVPPPRPGEPTIDLHRYQVDQHRQEMERLRIQSGQREVFARQIEREARLNRQRLEATRQPAPVLTPSPRATLSLAQERDRHRTGAGVEQIDAWLDRDRD